MTPIFTIFGASGDLAKLKIFPSLYALVANNKLPENFFIFGFARTNKTHEEFREEFKNSVKQNSTGDVNEALLEKLIQNIFYVAGQYSDTEAYRSLDRLIIEQTKDENYKQVAYFSVPPVVFANIVTGIANSLEKRSSNAKLVIEKPFGENRASAEDLFHFIGNYFEEDQVYLLDHYLGKRSVRNILSLRHSNRILNSMIRGSEIANIQISLYEEVGVENRIDYFDSVGNIKDMFQSHILQMLALITMDIPFTSSSESLSREKFNILSALNFEARPENFVTGQYKSYAMQKGVGQGSNTDTYAAFYLFIDKQGWYNVPVFVRFGKKLEKKHTYIVIELKKFPFQTENEEPNRLIFELHPEDKVTVKVYNLAEMYGQEVNITGVIPPDPNQKMPEYGILIDEILRGEKHNFLTFPEILASWEVVDKMVDLITTRQIKAEVYEDHSTGPESASKIPGQQGFKWFEMK